MIRRSLILCCAVLCVGGGFATPALADGPTSPATLEGSVLGSSSCTYDLTATATGSGVAPDWSEGHVTGTIGCGSTVSVSATASWTDTSGDISISGISGSLLGQTISAPSLPWDVNVPDDPTQDLPNFISDFASQALQEAQDKLLSSPITIGPKSILGGACSFTLQATNNGSDWTSGTVVGTVTCGSGALQGSLQVTATWDGTDIQISDIEGTFDGQPISDSNGSELSLPDVGSIDIGNMASDLATQVEGQVEDFVQSKVQGLVDNASSIFASANNLPDSPGSVLDGLDSFCKLLPDPAGPAYTKPPPALATANRFCQTLVDYQPSNPLKTVEDQGAEPDYSSLDGNDDTSSVTDDADEAQACPPLSVNPPPDLFVVCVPMMLAGDLNLGSKSLILMPGGAILALPIGTSLSAPFTPSIETSSSILLMGGAIGGANLKISAKSFAAAGMAISMTGGLEIDAPTVQIGEVNTQALLGFVPSVLTSPVDLAGDLGNGTDGVASWLTSVMPADLTVPSSLWASTLTIKAGALTVDSGSSLSADGLGGAPEQTPGSTALIGPGSGEGAGYFGGSNMGYGGVSENTSAIDAYTVPGQRQTPDYDDPFNPTKPGNGGFGDTTDGSDSGNPGGGVVSISATSLVLNGQIRANGDDAFAETPGGAGSGGSVNINTGTFSGSGSVQANGGGISQPTQPEAFSAGNGGGGAVAVHYTSNSGFTGSYSAHGGIDDDLSQTPHRDLGGAGTVFLQQIATAPTAPNAPSVSSSSSSSDALRSPFSATRRRHKHHSAKPGSDKGPTRLSGLRLSASTFSAARTGKSVATPTAADAKSTVGVTLTYRDSGAGVARFEVLTETKPKLLVSASHKARPRTTVVGRFTHADRSGENTIRFTGRLGTRALSPGAYELVGSGRHGGTPQVRATFTVVGAATTPSGVSVTVPAPTGISAGTLIIDGGVTALYPGVEPTPLPDSWSDPNRDLVIGGGAVVEATNPTYAKISIGPTAVLTAASITRALNVTAGEIDISAGGRIDMTGHGYAGGPFDADAPYAGETAPGASPSQGDSGGSHGGLGGTGESSYPQVGSVYDDPYDPTLPGGGGGGAGCTDDGYLFTNPSGVGGGVLYVNATTVNDSGAIASDGQASNGPSLTLPSLYEGCGGAGAGGSVQVHVQTLTGDGIVAANGGDVCLGDAQLLDTNPADYVDPCSTDTSGAGGGGDVLVVAASHGGWSGTLAAKGGVNYIRATVTVAGKDYAVGGAPGSTIGP